MRALSLVHAIFFLAGLLLSGRLSSAQQTDAFTELLHRGFDYHQRADYANSLPLLEQAHKLDPQDYFVNLLLGIDLLRTRKPAEALHFLAVASRARPSEDFPYEYSAEANALLGRYADAAASYLKAMAISPGSAEAIEGWVDYGLERFRQLAGSLRSSQRGLAAEYRLQARSYPAGDAKRRQLLEQASSLDPKAPGIWSEIASADFFAGDSAGADKHSAAALEANSSDLRAMEVKALLGASADDWPQVSLWLGRISERSPATLALIARRWPTPLRPVDERLVHGAATKLLRCSESKDCVAADFKESANGKRELRPPAALFAEQRWDELAELREPLKSNPQLPFQRGVALAMLARCDQAIPVLERSLAAQSDRVDASFLLSQCYADEAGRADDRMMRSGGDQALSHTVRGDVLLRLQGDAPGSIAEYQAALAIRHNDPRLLERLAEAQLAAGKFDEAEANARAALLLDAHRFSARQTLARVAMEQGKSDQAIPVLRALVAENAQDQEDRVSLATALSQTGASSEALSALQSVLTSGYPDQKGSLHSLLGALLRKTGHTAEAAEAYAEARRLSEAYQQSSHREAPGSP